MIESYIERKIGKWEIWEEKCIREKERKRRGKRAEDKIERRGKEKEEFRAREWEREKRRGERGKRREKKLDSIKPHPQ